MIGSFTITVVTVHDFFLQDHYQPRWCQIWRAGERAVACRDVFGCVFGRICSTKLHAISFVMLSFEQFCSLAETFVGSDNRKSVRTYCFVVFCHLNAHISWTVLLGQFPGLSDHRVIWDCSTLDRDWHRRMRPKDHQAPAKDGPAKSCRTKRMVES